MEQHDAGMQGAPAPCIGWPPAAQNLQLRKAGRELPYFGQVVHRLHAVTALQGIGQQGPVVGPGTRGHRDAVPCSDVQCPVLLAGGGGGSFQIQCAGEQHLTHPCPQPVQRIEVILAGQTMIDVGRGPVVQGSKTLILQPAGQLLHERRHMLAAQFGVHHETAEGQATVADADVAFC